jgi:hypothetical protein
MISVTKDCTTPSPAENREGINRDFYGIATSARTCGICNEQKRTPALQSGNIDQGALAS